MILIYLTGLGLQSTCTTNLDHKYKILLDMDLEILELWFKIMIDFNMPLEKYEDFIDKYSSFLWGAPVTYKGSSNQWSTVIFKQHKNLLYTCLLSFGITMKMTNCWASLVECKVQLAPFAVNAMKKSKPRDWVYS